jgi:phosphohistidine phosphatase SixA
MKKLVCLVRHAKAMDREDFKGKDDSLRPLTPEGEKKFEKTLKRLKKAKIKIKHSYHSPFLRCAQSAKILESCFKIKSKPSKKLAHGGKTSDFYSFLLKVKKNSAIISHEPELSELMLLLGIKGPLFKKGELRVLEIKKKKNQYSFKVIRSSHSR